MSQPLSTDVIQAHESAGDPAAVADKIVVYSKDVAGVTQLFARTSAGTVYQLTPVTTAGPSANLVVWTLAKTWAQVYTEIQAAVGPVLVLVEFNPATYRTMTNNGGAPTNLWNVQFWALAHNGWNIPNAFRVVEIRPDSGFVLGVDPDSGFAILLSQNIEWQFDVAAAPIVDGDPVYFEINGGKLGASGTDPLTITDTFYLEVSNNGRMIANNRLTGNASRVAVLTGAQLNGTFDTITGAHTIDVFVDALSQISGAAFDVGITPTYFGSAVYLVSPDGTEWTGTVDNTGTLTFS